MRFIKSFGDLTTSYYRRSLLNYDGLYLGVSNDKVPHLVFEYTITTHEFFSSSYFKPLTKKQTKLQNEIMRLHNKGWGYTKIHRCLVKNGFKIGKSRTTVDSIIKKRLGRDRFFGQETIED